MLLRSHYLEVACLQASETQLNQPVLAFDLLAIHAWQLLILVQRYKSVYTVCKHLFLAQVSGLH
ncbi:hypothetical protein GCM10008090_11090 [Arenicella chitinivorans]|uniref:Uncharacterized protein n=1 Tax=Arenicella chitinivorans TaxID=1329800 RepID=A0A918RM22_9GAMM|nr:hypothetical protein [Arenicella chitinivorans]GHA03702.1 hypothetical protein GCM10008090_11090 [Arenicella chitinivorans]